MPFAEAFDENQIELVDLPELTDEDLRELGLPMGTMKRLLKAIAAIAAPDQASTENLSERPTSTAAVLSSLSATSEAERRQLTVMFCDLAGSTALSERFDPEGPSFSTRIPRSEEHDVSLVPDLAVMSVTISSADTSSRFIEASPVNGLT